MGDHSVALGKRANDLEFDVCLVPGATGPIPKRLSPDEDPIVMGIPPVTIGNRTYTRTRIAAETGISISHLSRLFSGERRPSLPMALKLANYFGVTVERLLGEVLPRKIAVRRKSK